MFPPPAASRPLLALCPSGSGVTGLALEAGAPLAAARLHRLAATDVARAARGLERRAGFASSLRPAAILVQGEAEPLFACLRGREAALPLAGLLPPPPPEAVLRLFAIADMNDVMLLARCPAFIAGAYAAPGARERAERHGLTLLWLDDARIYAALVFRGALHALAEFSFPSLFPAGEESGADGLALLLDDFRLGWLPREEAVRHGGAVWRAGALPDEAEGFKPLLAAGPGAKALAGRAWLAAGEPDETPCRGALCLRLLAEGRVFA